MQDDVSDAGKIRIQAEINANHRFDVFMSLVGLAIIGCIYYAAIYAPWVETLDGYLTEQAEAAR